MRIQGGLIRRKTNLSPWVDPFVADNGPFSFGGTAAAEEVIV